MNSMRKYSTVGICASLLFVFSIFTLLSISEVNAEEIITVNANGYENSVIIEFENESEYKIKTVRVWLGGDETFKSFKTESGWGGGEYSDGKMLIFTATNILNPGESVKFGFTTNEKVTAINWKALDSNEQPIDQRKTTIQIISDTTSSFTEVESKEVDEAKETGSQLYGSKYFIPEKIRVGSDIRLVGNGFDSEQSLKLYIDNVILKSVNTDNQGNFLTTVSIPDNQPIGITEFIIKDEFGNIQSTNINVEESKDRFLKTTQFDVIGIPAEVRFDETLTISGNAYPKSAVMISFEDADRILEKTRVVIPNSNGEWVYEEVISRNENVGEKYVIIENNHDKTTKSLKLKSDYVVQISLSAIRYNPGETVIVTGIGEPNKQTTMLVKNEDGKIIHYDVFTSKDDGSLDYRFPIDENNSGGTYSVIIKQENGADASLFGIEQYPSSTVVTLMEQSNFSLNSKAILNVIGPQSTKLSVKILDDNDSIKITDSITTSSTGKIRYVVDLDDLPSGIYVAAVGTGKIQDSIKFSVGLESGSGDITLITTQENYSPGESILVIGNTGVDARITITLYEPSGKVSSVTETFSDGSGSFSTDELGIPTDGVFGDWRITAHSRLDSKSLDINVSLPTENTLTLDIENTEFSLNDTVTIKGIAKSNANRLLIEIFYQGNEIAQLNTSITSDDTYSVPWAVPNGSDPGTYTIRVSDGQNSISTEVFIQ